MTLIRTINQFRAYVPVNVSSELENLLPDLRTAERTRVRPLLGPALYNELSALSDADVAAALDDGGGPTGGLLHLVQEALANLAALEHLPLGQVQISDYGISLKVDKTAFQWQINELRASFRRKGYDALEEVLGYLDEHQADFPAWVTSAAAGEARRQLLPSAAEFTRHYDIGGSRLTYQALLPVLRRVERFEVGAVLGPLYLAELRAELLAGAVSAPNQHVLDEYVRPALACLTVAKAVPEIGLSLRDGNLELNVYRFDAANEKEADASLDKLLAQKVSQAHADGTAYLVQLRQYLNRAAGPGSFASYYHSSAYTDPAAARPTVVSRADSPTYFFG